MASAVLPGPEDTWSGFPENIEKVHLNASKVARISRFRRNRRNRRNRRQSPEITLDAIIRNHLFDLMASVVLPGPEEIT